MYECGKLKKVRGNKFLFPVILEQCANGTPYMVATIFELQVSKSNLVIYGKKGKYVVKQ